ncbi:cytochrome P460 family protein [Methylomarinum vadi]|uniref:cytochrome P460 family protein n=1 Tax=Methylomarinum vadi TaxID=438855 RepID=UPI000A0028E1|nr:cytochrome P460 family protein [Methylomarinum vadi]
MKQKSSTGMLTAVLMLGSQTLFAKDIAPAPNGIEVPRGYQNWQFIGTSHRTDNSSLRIIVGNDIAVKAIESGKTKPWPKGSVLGKLVWKDSQHPDWAKATVPGELSHIEFMIKDAVKYKKTGGWGYARWKGMDAVPYGKDENFAKECFNCHSIVKKDDYVFTHPVKLP